MDKNIYKKSATALKIAFQSTNWWSLVQQEVKKKLEFLLDNLEFLGPSFRDAFVSYFKYENLIRILNGESEKINQPGVLFGPAMTEECYQCGKKVTKALLDLDDWTEPNEADVQCCLSICNQIDKWDFFSEQPTSVFEDLLVDKIDTSFKDSS